ncbi:MAG: pyridoxamine 5'-phosphate oxidase family protein [Bacteroidales bacterium]
MASRMLKDPERISQIINKCEVCYLGMVDEQGAPYVLPFNFGYEQGVIYLHSAATGRKIDILKQNSNVCVSFSTDHQLFHRHEPVACSYGMRYRSALAFGKVVFIDDYQEKERILNVFMRKYAGREFSFNAPAVNNVAVYKVEVSRLEGKESGY